MDKFYSHIYKNGISSIAKNNSSVSKNGKITQKNGVESLNNFFDLRNFVVLNNSFLLKGLFAATLFCGCFVGELKAQTPYVSINSNKTGPNTNHDSDGAKGADSIAIGVEVNATQSNAIAIGQKINAGQNSIAIGFNAGSEDFASTSVFIGYNAGNGAKYHDKITAKAGWGSVMIGQDAGKNSKGDSNFYIGSSAGQTHTGSQNIFFGDTAKTIKYTGGSPIKNNQNGSFTYLVDFPTFGNRNIYIGNKYIHGNIPNSDNYINDTIAIGTLANADKSKGIAIGSSSSGSKYGALSIGKNSIAIGTSTDNNKNGATAEGDNSISFGADTKATAIDGIALGSFSIANKKSLTKDDQKKVFLYDDENVEKTVKNTKGALSVGNNEVKEGDIFTRQIINVAAGSKDSDAVNVAQLRAGLDQGLKFAANSGVNDYTAKLGTTISVKGDDKNTDWNNFDSGQNIMTNVDKDGNILVGLSKKLSGLESVTIENGPSMSQTGINAGGKKITNLADAIDDTDAVAYGQVKNLINEAKTEVTGKIKFKVDNDEQTGLNNNILTINGDNKNITTSTDKNGKIKVSLNDKVELGGGNNESKIELGKDGLRITQADGKTEGPSITTNGINAGNKVLTNLASGLDGRKLEDIKKDIDNAGSDPTKMPKEASNAATIGDLANVNSDIIKANTDITNITNTTNNINNVIGGNTFIDNNGKLTGAGEKALATNAASGQGVIENTNIIQAINNINKQGTRFFHVNDGKDPIGIPNKDTLDSSAGSSGGVAIGVLAKVGDKNSAQNAIAIGTSSQSLAQNAIAIGANSNVNVEGGVALGSGSVANRTTKLDGVFIPNEKTIEPKDKQAIEDTVKGTLGVVSVGEFNGAELKASRQITGVAAGTEDSDAVNVAQLKAAVKQVVQGTQWIAADTTKITTPTKAGGENSVAIGPGSNTKIIVNGKTEERTNTVSVGSKDIQRTISNVAPGVYDSDAATMGQLRAGLNEIQGKFNKYKKQASAGTASAMAMGNMPQSTIPGKGMMSLGSGFYDGQSAMAIGLSKMSDDGKWVFKGSASYDSQEKAGAALSIGFHF